MISFCGGQFCNTFAVKSVDGRAAETALKILWLEKEKPPL
jgi:ArsR family metal-binding transcriptional regulator